MGISQELSWRALWGLRGLEPRSYVSYLKLQRAFFYSRDKIWGWKESRDLSPNPTKLGVGERTKILYQALWTLRGLSWGLMGCQTSFGTLWGHRMKENVIILYQTLTPSSPGLNLYTLKSSALWRVIYVQMNVLGAGRGYYGIKQKWRRNVTNQSQEKSPRERTQITRL